LKSEHIAEYKNDLLTLILNSVFVEGKTIRTQITFEQSLKENKSLLVTRAVEIANLALEIMKGYGELKTSLQRLNATDSLTKSLDEQLNYLIYSGFIRTIPFAQFKHTPRYLKAMQYRLDKRDNTPQKANELARFQIRYWNSVSQRLKKEIVTPETEVFRWMLEEFAVSLFAQQLKTAIPVSAQRLEKAWDLV
jgi:ATP-dependent helicase HrpA